MSRFFFIFTSWVLLFTFSVNSVLASNLPSISTPETPQVPVSIPSNLGKVLSRSPGAAGKPTVYLIQDAHSIAGAQRSIQGILDHLTLKNQVSLVALEGAAGPLATDLLRAYPDPVRLRDVLWKEAEEGTLSGVEIESILGPGTAEFQGIEKRDVYDKNFEAFRKAHQAFESYQPSLDACASALKELIEKRFSTDLKKSWVLRENFNAGSLSLLAYLEGMIALAGSPPASSPALHKMAGLIAEEKRAEGDVEVIRWIRSAFGRLAKGDKMTLALLKQKSDTSQISKVDLVRQLRAKLEVQGNFGETERATLSFIARQEEIDRISGTDFMEELTAWTRSLEDKWTGGDPTLRKILVQEKKFQIVKHYLTLELTREEWLETQKDPASFTSENFKSEILRLRHSSNDFAQDDEPTPKAYQFSWNLEPARQFYRLVTARDRIFSKTLQSLIREKRPTAVAVVTGGFHTEALASELKSKGFPVAVIQPRFEVTGESPYLKVMMDAPSPNLSHQGRGINTPSSQSSSPLKVSYTDGVGESAEPPLKVRGGRGSYEDSTLSPEVSTAKNSPQYKQRMVERVNKLLPPVESPERPRTRMKWFNNALGQWSRGESREPIEQIIAPLEELGTGLLKRPVPETEPFQPVTTGASLGELKPEKIQAFERELGIQESDLRIAVEKFPQLAGLNPARVRDEWMAELGIPKEALASAIQKNPQLAGRSPARVRDEWMAELGIPKEPLALAIQKHPQLAGLSPARVRDEWKAELGIPKEALASAIQKWPQLVALSPARIRDEWQTELGISKDTLASAIQKFPPLPGYSPARVRDEWQKELGVSKEALASAIQKNPQLASRSPARVRDEWMTELGIPKEPLALAIQKHPQLAGYSPARVRDEWMTELGIPKEALASAIQKFPQLAGLSVSDNLKPKLEMIRKAGIEKERELGVLRKLATANVTLLTLIMKESEAKGVVLTLPAGLGGIYKKLNDTVKAQEGKSATLLIKDKTRPNALETVVRPTLLSILETRGASLGKKDFEIFYRIAFGPERGRADSNAFFVFKGGNLPGAAEYQKEVLQYLEGLGYEVHSGTNVPKFDYDKQFVYWPEAYSLQLIQGPGRDQFVGEPGYQEFIEDMKLGYSYVTNKEYEKFQVWFQEALKKPGIYQKDIGLRRQEFMTEVFNAGGASVWVRRKASRRDVLEKLGLLDKWAVIQKPDGTYSYFEDEALKTVFGEQDPKKISELAKKEKLAPGWVFQAPEQTFFKYVVGGSADSGRKAHSNSIRNRFWREVEKGRFDNYLNSIIEREKNSGLTLWEGDTKRVFTLFWNMVHLPYADEFKDHMALSPPRDIQAWLRTAQSTAGRTPPDFGKWVAGIPSRPRLDQNNMHYLRDRFIAWWGEAVRFGVPEDKWIPAIETYIRLATPWFLEPSLEREITNEDVQWVWNYFSSLYGGVDISNKRKPGTYDIRTFLGASEKPGVFLERLDRWITTGTKKFVIATQLDRHPMRIVLGFLYSHQEAFRTLLRQVGTGKGDPDGFWNWVNGTMRISVQKTRAAIDRGDIPGEKFNEDFLKNLDEALAQGVAKGKSLGEVSPDDLSRAAIAFNEEERKDVDRLSADGSMPSARLADLDGLSQQGQSLGDGRLGQIIEGYRGPGDIHQWSEQQFDEAVQMIEQTLYQTLSNDRWEYRELITRSVGKDRMPSDEDVRRVFIEGIPIYQNKTMAGVFLPSDIRELFTLFRALKIPKGTPYLSLGSGLGSDSIVAAMFGLDVTMAEIDPRLLALSRKAIQTLSEGENPLLKNVTIRGDEPVDYLSDSFKFTPFQAIYYFDRGLVGSHNWKRLEQKMKTEMSQDAALLVYQENVWNKNAKTFSELKQIAGAPRLGRLTGLSNTHNFLSVYQRPDGQTPEYIRTFQEKYKGASLGTLEAPKKLGLLSKLTLVAGGLALLTAGAWYSFTSKKPETRGPPAIDQVTLKKQGVQFDPAKHERGKFHVIFTPHVSEVDFKQIEETLNAISKKSAPNTERGNYPELFLIWEQVVTAQEVISELPQEIKSKSMMEIFSDRYQKELQVAYERIVKEQDEVLQLREISTRESRIENTEQYLSQARKNNLLFPFVEKLYHWSASSGVYERAARLDFSSWYKMTRSSVVLEAYTFSHFLKGDWEGFVSNYTNHIKTLAVSSATRDRAVNQQTQEILASYSNANVAYAVGAAHALNFNDLSKGLAAVPHRSMPLKDDDILFVGYSGLLQKKYRERTLLSQEEEADLLARSYIENLLTSIQPRGWLFPKVIFEIKDLFEQLEKQGISAPEALQRIRKKLMERDPARSIDTNKKLAQAVLEELHKLGWIKEDVYQEFQKAAQEQNLGAELISPPKLGGDRGVMDEVVTPPSPLNLRGGIRTEEIKGASLGVEEDYEAKLEAMTTIPWQELPQETRDILTQFGVTDSLVELGKASGENAGDLFQLGLPALKKIFTPEELKAYWPDLVELGKVSGVGAWGLFQLGLPALKKIFTPEELKAYWPDLVELGKASGKDAWLVFQKGLPSLKDLIKTQDDLKKVGQDLVELAKAGGNANDLFATISYLKETFTPEEFKTYWPDLVELGKASGKNVRNLFLYDLPALKKTITPEELKIYWPGLVELGKASGKDAQLVFRDILPNLRELYSTPKAFNQDWNGWKMRLLKLLKMTSDYNRGRVIKLIFVESKILAFIQTEGGDFKKHFDFYLKIVETYPRLSLQVLEGLFEGIQSNQFSMELLNTERDSILNFISFTHSFSPALYPIYEAKGEDGFKEIKAFSEKVLQDELSPKDITNFQTQLIAQGYKGKEIVLAGIQMAIPSSGASFVKREEVMGLFGKYLKAGDRREDIPQALRGPPDKNSQAAIVHNASFTQIEYRLLEGEALDPEGMVNKILSSLHYPDSGKPKEEVERLSQKDKETFIQILTAYLKDRSPENKSTALNAFLAYVSHNDLLKEKIDRIQSLDYQSLDLLEQLFLDKDNLSVLFREILDQDIPSELLLEKGAQTIQNLSGLKKQVQSIWKNPKLTEEAKLLSLENILKRYQPEELTGKLLPEIRPSDEGLHNTLSSLIGGSLQTPISTRTLLEDFFKDPIEAIQKEKAKFEAITLTNAIEVEFRIVKGVPYGLWGLCSGVCIATDLDLWKKKEFFLMAMIDTKTKQAAGFIHLFEATVNNQKILVIPGIEPSTEFLGEVKAKDLYPEMIQAIQKTARRGNYQAIYLPTDSNILSNRTDISKLATQQGYPKLSLSIPITWNTVPQPYPISEVYDVPVEGKSLGEEIGAPSPVQKILRFAPMAVMPLLFAFATYYLIQHPDAFEQAKEALFYITNPSQIRSETFFDPDGNMILTRIYDRGLTFQSVVNLSVLTLVAFVWWPFLLALPYIVAKEMKYWRHKGFSKDAFRSSGYMLKFHLSFPTDKRFLTFLMSAGLTTATVIGTQSIAWAAFAGAFGVWLMPFFSYRRNAQDSLKSRIEKELGSGRAPPEYLLERFEYELGREIEGKSLGQSPLDKEVTLAFGQNKRTLSLSRIVNILEVSGPQYGVGYFEKLTPEDQATVTNALTPDARRHLELDNFISANFQEALKTGGAGANLEIYERSNKETLAVLQNEIFRKGLYAHGVAADKGGLESLLAILLEGKIRSGQKGPLDASPNPQISAGPHGPFYVVLTDPSRADWAERGNHALYLVPENSDRKTLISVLQKAVRSQPQLISQELAQEIENKIITYEEFVKSPPQQITGASLGKDINVFGGGEFQEDHPLVKAGRIIKVTDYQNIGGENLVEYAKRLRAEKGVERIYLDLDLTVFRAMGYLSSSKWFENVHNLYGIGNTLGWWGDAGHEARQIANGFFFRLMDRALPVMIQELQAAKFEVLGLTARAARDQERTEKILKGLGIEIPVLYTGGAGNKGPTLDEYEKVKGPANGLFLEDSFKNLEGVLSGRSGLSGIYYEGPTSHSEDSWTYRDYLDKADDALKAGNWGHAFEYYYNAAIKIFELKDLTREEAYGEFEKIYQNLTGQLKDKNLEGYKTLETIVDIARKPEKESIYYQDARGRAAWEKRKAKTDALSAGLVTGSSLGSDTDGLTPSVRPADVDRLSGQYRPVYQMHPDKSIEEAVNEAIRGNYGVIAVSTLELGNRVKAYLSQKKLEKPLEIVGMDPRAFNVYKLSDLEQLEKIFKSSDADSRIASYHRLADLNLRESRKVLQLLIEALGREKDPRALPTLIHLIDQTTNPGIGSRWNQVMDDYQERQRGNVKAVEPLRQELTASSLKRTDSLFMENLDHFEAEALELAEVQRAIQGLQLIETEQLLANLAYNTKSRAHKLYLSRKERAGVPFQRIVYYNPVPYGSLDISAMKIQILDLESPKVLINEVPVIEGGKWIAVPSLENQTALHQYLDEHGLKTVKQRIDWGEQFAQYFRQYSYDPNRFSWDEFAEQEKLPSKEPPAFVEYVRSSNEAEIFKFNVTQPYRLMGLATHLFGDLLAQEKGLERVRFNNFQNERDRAFIQSLVSNGKIHGPYGDTLGSYYTLKPLKIDITELSRFSHDLALTLEPVLSYEKRATAIANAFQALIKQMGLEDKFAFYFSELDAEGDLKKVTGPDGQVSQYWRSVERRGLEGKSRMSDVPGLFTGEKKVFEGMLRLGYATDDIGAFRNDFLTIDSRKALPEGIREDAILAKDQAAYGDVSDKITYGAFRWFDKGEILGVFWIMGNVSEEDREVLNMARVLISQVLAKSFQLEVLKRYSASVALSRLELDRINQINDRTRTLADKVHQGKGTLSLLEKRLTAAEFESARKNAVQVNEQVEGLSRRVEGYLNNLNRVQKELWDAQSRIGSPLAGQTALRGVAGIQSPELDFYSKVIQAKTPSQLELIQSETIDIPADARDGVLKAASAMIAEINDYQSKIDQIQTDKEQAKAVLREIESQIGEMTESLSNFVNTFTDEWLDQNLSSFNTRTADWIRGVIKTVRETHQELLELLKDTEITQKIEVFDAVEEVRKVFQEESVRGDESGIDYQWTSPVEHFEIASDPSIIKDTVVRSLLSNAANAVRYFREVEIGDKRISLSVEPLNDYLRIRVSDTGPGFDWMNPEVRAKLFTLGGRQLTEGSERNLASTGLGLSLAQSRLRAIGGDLYLEKTQKGKGSTFTVLLPKDPTGVSNVPVTEQAYQSVMESIDQRITRSGSDTEMGLDLRLIRDQMVRAKKDGALTHLFFEDIKKVLSLEVTGAASSVSGQSLGGLNSYVVDTAGDISFEHFNPDRFEQDYVIIHDELWNQDREGTYAILTGMVPPEVAARKASLWRGYAMSPESFVARDPAGRPVGVLFAYEKSTKLRTIFIHSFYVRRDMQRRGIGDQLLKLVAQGARTRGAHTIALDVNEGTAAVDYYRKRGFEEFDRNELLSVPMLRMEASPQVLLERLSGKSLGRASAVTPEALAESFEKVGYLKTLEKFQIGPKAYLSKIKKLKNFQNYLSLTSTEIEEMREKKIELYGVWQSLETVKNATFLALDTISGFKEARESENVKQMAELYRKHVINYKAKDIEKFRNGQVGFFYEVGGLNGLLTNTHPEHGWKKQGSPAELIRTVLPGLIDVRNPDSLDPLEVEIHYWSDLDNVKYHTLLALDIIPGFKEARESGNVKQMAELYRHHVINYKVKDIEKFKNGQLGFFFEVGGLQGLLTHPHPEFGWTKTNSPAELIRSVLPGLIDVRNPDSLDPLEVENHYWSDLDNVKYHTLLALDIIPGFKEARESENIKQMAELYRHHVINYKAKDIEKFRNGQQSFFHEVGGLNGLLINAYPEHGWKKQGSPAELIRSVLPGLIDIHNPDSLDPLEVERDYWSDLDNVKYHTFLALDIIPGFKEARESGNVKQMAELYRHHVINYKAKDIEKFNNRQLGFFHEVGGLRGLLINDHPEHGWTKKDSPAELIRSVLPELYPYVLQYQAEQVGGPIASYYQGYGFLSKLERNTAIILIHFGIISEIKGGETWQIEMGDKRIDFYSKEFNTYFEPHGDITRQQSIEDYRKERRQILDDAGFRDSKLYAFETVRKLYDYLRNDDYLKSKLQVPVTNAENEKIGEKIWKADEETYEKVLAAINDLQESSNVVVTLEAIARQAGISEKALENIRSHHGPNSKVNRAIEDALRVENIDVESLEKPFAKFQNEESLFEQPVGASLGGVALPLPVPAGEIRQMPDLMAASYFAATGASLEELEKAAKEKLTQNKIVPYFFATPHPSPLPQGEREKSLFVVLDLASLPADKDALAKILQLTGENGRVFPIYQDRKDLENYRKLLTALPAELRAKLLEAKPVTTLTSKQLGQIQSSKKLGDLPLGLIVSNTDTLEGDFSALSKEDIRTFQFAAKENHSVLTRAVYSMIFTVLQGEFRDRSLMGDLSLMRTENGLTIFTFDLVKLAQELTDQWAARTAILKAA